MEMNIQIAINCADPHSQADFWADALGYTVDRDPDEVREVIAAGHATLDDTTEHKGVLVWRTGAACNDPTGRLPRLYFQLVPEAKVGMNRLHLDLHFPPGQRDAEVERLKGLGATHLYDGRQGSHTWITMADPEGNEFCVA